MDSIDQKDNDEPQLVVPSLMCSCRLTISLMSMAAMFGALLMTMNLGMAIVCFNQPTNSYSNCSNITDNTELVGIQSTCSDPKADAIEWDKESQGLLLGATYYGVVAAQILVGWLSDKFGKMKLQMISGNIVMGLLSILSPILIQQAGVPLYLTARILQGAAMCFGVSSILPLINHWITPKEQGLLIALSFSGVGLASSLTYPISGFLCAYLGWKSIFYFAGGYGLVWSVAAFFLLYNHPATHPRISAEEKQYLLSFKTKAQQTKQKKVVIPWKKILLSVPVWAVILSNFFFFAAQKGTVINLPLYIRDVLDFSVTENGIYSALPPFLALITHMITGPVFDWARSRDTYSVTTIRKIFLGVGTIIPAGLMFTASQLDPEQKYVIVALIAVGYAFYEVGWVGGCTFSLMDMAPDYVGVLQGINNTIGLTPGFMMPVIIAALTPNGSREEWSYVFIMFGGLYILAFLIYLVMGNSELQSWGKAKIDAVPDVVESSQSEKLVR